MRNKLVLKMLALAFGAALVAGACSSSSDSSQNAEDAMTQAEKEMESAETSLPSQNLVQIASELPQFSTLVELVTAANLAGTLSGTGPYTVMAPTNDAFAAVPAATIAQLKADPSGALTEVLKLHVISGAIDSEAAAAAAGTCVDTLGGKVKIEKVGDDLTFGGAKITSVDVIGSNGIIHIIDGVVTAPSTDC